MENAYEEYITDQNKVFRAIVEVLNLGTWWFRGYSNRTLGRVRRTELNLTPKLTAALPWAKEI
jgi:hypothetical protein